MPEYTVTIHDIQTYLATLQPDDVAGKTGDTQYCLIARALEHKYHKTFYVGAGGFWGAESQVIPFTEDISAIRSVFDYSPLGLVVAERTRAQVEKAIPVLKVREN